MPIEHRFRGGGRRRGLLCSLASPVLSFPSPSPSPFEIDWLIFSCRNPPWDGASDRTKLTRREKERKKGRSPTPPHRLLVFVLFRCRRQLHPRRHASHDPCRSVVQVSRPASAPVAVLAVIFVLAVVIVVCVGFECSPFPPPPSCFPAPSASISFSWSTLCLCSVPYNYLPT